ncbi:uncharacterized protein N7482_005722 [Penicillium canariense]|uniref:N-acetyltransferase domain-containing protein n=1 Tax=Penicillium canariense TaxID=189055 RepID=A0A9W9I328_9EURO|nr:uncharacterized protein N7482_005722 [Penicillium canariense]KAJ5166941.1 hypothetical protein N7482_005722 [Penicillium canariense]
MAAPHPKTDEVICIPKTFSSPTLEQEVVERYKNLRLYGLKVDPRSFSSTYEAESQFSDDTWRSRIQNPVGKTFASMMDSNTQLPVSKIEGLVQSHGMNDALYGLLQKEWAGIVTLVGPGVLRSNEDATTAPSKPHQVFIRDRQYQIPQTVPELDDLSGAHMVYMLVGMFVSPSARRRGHGQRLLEAAIAAAAEETIILGGRKASIAVQAESGNHNAQRLYERVGFKVTDEAVEIEERDGAKSLVVSLEMELDLPGLKSGSS